MTIEPDDWSQLARQRAMPEIDAGRMQAYRLARVREQLRRAGAALGVFVSPVSLRYVCIMHGVGMCDEAPKLFYPLLRTSHR